MYLTLSLVIVLSFAVGLGRTAGEAFSYDAQNVWGGVCTTGSRQSPINIVDSSVVGNSTLTALSFSSGWTMPISGKFENKGTTVEFTPTSTSAAGFTVQFLGTYDVQQFHMHWGATDMTGSEHRVNGGQSEVEIHFVHYKSGATDATQGDYAAVVSVLADIVNEPISGIWAQLNLTAIQSNTSSALNLTGLTLNYLLPEDRDYYYYPGSLTTPGCNEIVQWFVLRNRITVPMAFVQQLRMIEEANGEPLTMNYRNVQPLNGRNVQTPSSQSFNKPALIILLVAIFLTSLF